jgi:hypothetical protein
MNTIVNQYGLLRPRANAALVREQMWLAHKYENNLIKIEKERRFLLRELEATPVEKVKVARATYEAAVATREAINKRISATRSKSRSRSETGEDREELTKARVVVKEARVALALARLESRTDPFLVAGRAAIEAAIHPRVLAAYAESLCYSPTKDLIRSAMDQVRKMPLWDGTEPNDPHFRRWEGEGSVGVQLTGESCQTDEGRARWLQLVPLNELGKKANPSSRRSCERRRMTLRMRVGSDGRDPVWAEWPMLMHRPLPPGAVLRRATVHCRRIGPTERWCVDLTIATPDEWRREECGAGAVSIDIGWRTMDGRLRVGVWLGEDGSGGEIAISSDLLESFREVDGLQSVRDKTLDRMRRWLWRWRQKRLDTLPEWFVTETTYLWEWESQERLARLVKRWERDCPELYPRVLAVVERWRYHDHHLWEWQEHARINTLATRNKQYREIGAMLARRYSVLVLEDFDLRKIARRPKTESKPENEHAKKMRHRAATSKLRQACQQAFVSRGGAWVMVEAAHTTDTCWEHDSPIVSDAASDAVVRYECGCIVDQDEHSCGALLQRYRDRPSGERERPDPTPSPGGARKRILSSDDAKVSGTKWQRRKAKAS